jgi:hypothetical protein
MASKAKKESDNVVEVGMTAESRDLYREDPRQAWEEWAPEDIGLHATSKNASEGFALIVRREKRNGDSGEPVLALHSVKVQSPLIKARLHSVFEGYKGINTNLNKLEFSAPFREFFYRWSEFVRAAPDELEAEADRKHFQLLFKTMQTEIMPHLEQAGDYLKNNVISFGYLWTLFEPGTEIYSKVDGQHRLYLLNGGQYTEVCGMKVYTLSCRYIDTDGEKFGCADASLVIPQFADVKPITELNVLPSNLQPGIEEIRLALRERGRRFERLQGVHFKAYSGTYIIRSPPVGMMPSQYVSSTTSVIGIY